MWEIFGLAFNALIRFFEAKISRYQKTDIDNIIELYEKREKLEIEDDSIDKEIKELVNEKIQEELFFYATHIRASKSLRNAVLASSKEKNLDISIYQRAICYLEVKNDKLSVSEDVSKGKNKNKGCIIIYMMCIIFSLFIPILLLIINSIWELNISQSLLLIYGFILFGLSLCFLMLKLFVVAQRNYSWGAAKLIQGNDQVEPAKKN